MRLKDKVVVVTASTRGIGWAIVQACAKEGAIVIMAARNLEVANKKAEDLCSQGYCVKTVYNDATKKETYKTMIEEVVKNEGRVDVLVNNFGTSDPATDLDIETTDYQHFIDTIDMNLSSVYLASQAAIVSMKQQGGGSIVNISSIGGSIPDISRIGYAVAKSGITYLSKNMAVQLAKDKIRVNVVLPGMTATDAVLDNMSEQFQTFFTRHVPLGRMGLPEEIASAVLYFASDESAFTTGQEISVSGGFGLATPLYADMLNMASKR